MLDQGRKRAVRVVSPLGLALCIGLLFPTSALALRAHPLLEPLGSANQPSFVEPEGMAVDQATGALLVIDGEANAISRYNPDGTPADFSALGSNVIDGAGTGDATPQGGLSFGGPGEVQVAVDSSGGVTDGNIYVPQGSAKVVDIFGENGSYLGQLSASSEGSFGEPCGVAVGPDGNVFVGDFRKDSIHRFDPAANPPVDGDNSANFAFSNVCSVAAGSGPTDEFIFPVHFGGSVAKVDSATGEEKYEVSSGPTTTVAVDPASGHVFTAEGPEAREFDASGASGATEVSSTPLGSEGTGIAIDETSGDVYANHVGATNVEVFGPLSPGFALTIKKGSSDGEGTVETVAPRGISCGPSCVEASDLFSEGVIAELIATPEANSKFVGWTTIAGPAGTCVGANSPCQVILNSARELQADFEAIPVPEVTGLTPAEGPTAGGNLVEITGTGLSEAFAVEFAGTVLTPPFIENTDTSIKVKAPRHAGVAGVFDLVVTGLGGSSAITPADQYTYVLRPAIAGLSPATGPIAGDNEVEIVGLNLLNATKVAFGTTVLTPPFIENADTSIKVNAPAHAAGAVNVRVTTPGGNSFNFPAGEYTYALPTNALTVTRVGTGTGTVVSSPVGIDCGSECAHAFAEDAVVALSATANADSSFEGWSGACSGVGGCVVSMSAARSVTATFSANPIPDPPKAPEAGTPKVAASAAYGGGKAALQISCEGDGPCSGSLTLKARLEGKSRLMGTASYDIAAGQSATIKVKITNGQAKKALREGRPSGQRSAAAGLAGLGEDQAQQLSGASTRHDPHCAKTRKGRPCGRPFQCLVRERDPP